MEQDPGGSRAAQEVAARPTQRIEKDAPLETRRRKLFDALYKARRYLIAGGMIVTAANVDPINDVLVGSGTITLDRGEAPSFEEVQMMLALNEKVGKRGGDSRQQYYRRRAGRAEVQEQAAARLPVFENVESLGISSELLSGYMMDAFPRRWIDARNIVKMTFGVEQMPAAHIPGLPHAREIVASVQSAGLYDSPVTIQFAEKPLSPLSPKTAYQLFTEYVPHAIAHTLDWSHSLDLSAHDALLFQKIAVDRSTAEGRPLYSYPERIETTNPDELQQVTKHRSEEYFAELIKDSLRPFFVHTDVQDWPAWHRAFAAHLESVRGASSEEAEKNAALAEWIFKHTGDEFLPWVHAQQAQERLATIMDTIAHTYPEHLFDARIPPELTAKLLGGLERRLSTQEHAGAIAYLRQRGDGRGAGRDALRHGQASSPAVESVRIAWEDVLTSMVEIRTQRDVGHAPAASTWFTVDERLNIFANRLEELPETDRAMFLSVLARRAGLVLHQDISVE